MSANKVRRVVASRFRAGFSLVELMVAITLGILVSLGLVSVFGATSKTNHVQEMMAEIQENGRYAVTRVDTDLRLDSRQLMSMAGFYSTPPGANGMVNMNLAPDVYAIAGIPFPDSATPVGPPAGWVAALPTYTHWPLSPAYYMQGYSCTGSTCSPATTPSYVPAAGTAAGNRVQGTDILTVRYLNSQGWSSYRGEVSVPDCAAGGTFIGGAGIVLTPATGTYANVASNFVTGNLAMLTSSSGAMSIFAVTVGGAVLIPTAAGIPNGGSIPCPGTGETKLFNFSTDFITVTYWLQLAADPNVAGRVIPSLMRMQRDNTGATPVALELVQGVEQMNFLFSAQAADGSVQFVPASAMAGLSTAANCPSPPQQYTATIPGTYETNCMWRAVTSVETHLLLDSINNLYTLSAPETAYQYNGSGMAVAPVPTANITATGLKAGSMIRREFVTLTSIRNYNP